MQISSVLIFLFLLFSGCDPARLVMPIELSFQQLSVEEKEAFYADSLFLESEGYNFLKMSIQNNAYDSLYMALFKVGKHLLYSPCGYNAYRIERDSLILFKSSNPTFCWIDTSVCLLRNQSANLIFKGRCADQKTVYEYNFCFYGDSAGQMINPQFWYFPYRNVLPKKENTLTQ